MSASDTCRRLGWTLETVESTGSTNADLTNRTGNGLVLVARQQTAGRGRLDRSWVSAPGDGLTFSVRLDVPPTVSGWGWIPLLAGVASAEAIRTSGAQNVGLKWPNDVVGGAGKVAGILCVREDSSVIIGIGVNLAFSGQRPDSNAVSVAELGGNPDGEAILSTLLEQLEAWWQRFLAAGGDAQRSGLARAYVNQCVSVDVEVQVHAPDGTWAGQAQGIDEQGRLLVDDGTQVAAVSAGDVTVRNRV